MVESSSSFGSLAPGHEDLVCKYLKFIRAKRDIALQSMDGEFNDVYNDRLSEDMYSQDDVQVILDGLRSCVLTNLRQEVGAVTNMTALLMKQMLQDAEQQGATLAFDTGTVEDQALLEEVERMRVDGKVRTSSGKNFRRGGQASRLVSIKDELAQLVEKSQILQTKNEALQERVVRLQRDCSSLARERDENRAGIETLQEQLRFRADWKSETPSKEGANADAVRQEILELKEANEKRINESPQFQQLKRLVASKSQQVVALRRRLARYEPDEDEIKYQDEDDEQKA